MGGGVSSVWREELGKTRAHRRSKKETIKKRQPWRTCFLRYRTNIIFSFRTLLSLLDSLLSSTPHRVGKNWILRGLHRLHKTGLPTQNVWYCRTLKAKSSTCLSAVPFAPIPASSPIWMNWNVWWDAQMLRMSYRITWTCIKAIFGQEAEIMEAQMQALDDGDVEDAADVDDDIEIEDDWSSIVKKLSRRTPDSRLRYLLGGETNDCSRNAKANISL